MINWILENKEWVFSGVGVAIISAIYMLLSRRSKHGSQQKIVSSVAHNITQTNSSANEADQSITSKNARNIKQDNS